MRQAQSSSSILKKPKPFTRSERAFIFALAEILDSKDFDSVHVTELSSLSGFTKGAFYSRFEDKYCFAQKITAESARNHGFYLRKHHELRMQGTPLDSPEILESARNLLSYVYEYRVLYNMLIDRKLTGVTPDDFIQEAVAYGFADSEEFRPNPQTTKGFMYYVSVFNSIAYVMYWKRHNYQQSIDDMARMVSTYEACAFPKEAFVFSGS